MLVIVHVLDLLGFCHQRRHDPCVMILFRRYDGQISRILEHKDEQEHEHDPLISESGLSVPADADTPTQRRFWLRLPALLPSVPRDGASTGHLLSGELRN